ncbi:MAG: heavy metal translocating P-type ATPase [Oscillospiraceae bacterium]|nr:heavy metal translocating P-type ATPase [Oscillospiraceae bacterium]
MVLYNITGMSCAACSARIEKAVSAVSGVTQCSVNLLTNSMSVEGGESSAVINAVVKAGYGAELKDKAAGKSADNSDSADALEDKETPKMKLRLFWSLGFMVVLLYISMGGMMWGFPLPPFLEHDHIAMALVQLLLSGIIMVINQKFFISGFKGLIHRAPNMDTLVALGSAAAFGYSVYATFVMSNAMSVGNHELVMTYMDEMYYESAGVILTLITLGKFLEARSKGKTTDALKSLIKLAPKTAVLIKDGAEVTVPIEQVKAGDIFAVKAGESIPADAVIVEGETSVNESALTGESIPADKIVGDEVSAATINLSGYIRCKATRVGEDTSLSQIIKMVSDASATKAPISKIADRVSGVFVPAVITIALLTIAVWLITGNGVGYAIERGISVLVISCPCALGLATPVAIMVGSGMGAKNGILFKTAVSLEQTGKTEIVLLDKTGTITSGEPVVTDIVPYGEFSEDKLLETAYSLEKRSEHPLAKAIVKHAESRGFSAEEPEKFEVLRGAGISAVLDKTEYVAGNLRLCETYCDIPENVREKADTLANEGKTPLFFCRNKTLIGIIAVADEIKADSPSAIAELKNMGIKTVMLTGDNKRTAEAVGRTAGIDEVIAEVLPGDKENVVKRFQKSGRVAMVGDGINDAPALTRADIGIAIGAGADVAVDAADVVLMKSRLSDVPAAIRLSRLTLRNIHQNLFWAFFYNVIGIPLAAGVWIPLFGWKLSPMFGALAMSLSSFFVVTNALRLNFFNIYNPKHDKKIRKKANSSLENNLENTKEEITMEITMKIEGMMCGHCEATVKKALEAVSGVSEATVSHESGTAVVKLSEQIDAEILKKAVEDKDYKVTEIG